jgi:hypothetical protein
MFFGMLSMVFSIVVLHMKGSGAIFFGIGPVVLTFVYVLVFLMGKPPHYQGDLIEQYTSGANLDYQPKKMVRINPLHRAGEGENESA